MGAKWYYSGDINLEYGGLFYRLDNIKWGYADALRVTPCSDAGGQDNAYWIEELTVNLPDDKRHPERREDILASCGIDTLPKGRAGLHMLVDACVGYGSYDIEQSDVVQIGKAPDVVGTRCDIVRPTVILRGNASLRRYVRKRLAGM